MAPKYTAKGIAPSPKQAPRAYNMPPSTQTRRQSSPLAAPGNSSSLEKADSGLRITDSKLGRR